ncbi:MAG: YbhN family protein [Cytophagaceae bacterium]
MQYKQILPWKKAGLLKEYQTALKILLFTLSAFFIYSILRNKLSLSEDNLNFLLLIISKHNLAFILVLTLFPVNWGLEAMKWQLLAGKIEYTSFWSAAKGVLTGVSLGAVTPHAIGDYAGRILQLKSKERIKSLGAVFLSRIAQFYVTIYFGSIGLLFLLHISYAQKNFLLSYLIVFFIVIGNLFLIATLLLKNRILALLLNNRKFRFITRYFQIIKSYSYREIFRVLAYSFLRYIVFSLQFMILLIAFDVNPGILELFLGVSFVFLCKSVIPTLFDLGIRESAALYFFGLYQVDLNHVLLASLMLWIINIIIPSFLGLLFIFKMKFTEK